MGKRRNRQVRVVEPREQERHRGREPGTREEPHDRCAVVGRTVIESRHRGLHPVEHVAGSERDERQIDVPRVALFEGEPRRAHIGAETEQRLDTGLEQRDLLDVSREAEPDRRRSNRCRESEQVLAQHQGQETVECVRVRFIGRLEDRLPQPFLSLSRQQEALHELPGLRSRAAQQRDDRVAGPSPQLGAHPARPGARPTELHRPRPRLRRPPRPAADRARSPHRRCGPISHVPGVPPTPPPTRDPAGTDPPGRGSCEARWPEPTWLSLATSAHGTLAAPSPWCRADPARRPTRRPASGPVPGGART